MHYHTRNPMSQPRKQAPVRPRVVDKQHVMPKSVEHRGPIQKLVNRRLYWSETDADSIWGPKVPSPIPGSPTGIAPLAPPGGLSDSPFGRDVT